MRADGDIGHEKFARSQDHIQGRIKQLQSEEMTGQADSSDPPRLIDNRTRRYGAVAPGQK